MSALIEGLLLGLSTGTLCVLTCTPIYLPWLMSEQRGLWKNLARVMEISAGRFMSYIAFGALAGYFGSSIQANKRLLYGGISYILLSVFLLINTFRTHKEERSCRYPGWMRFSKSGFLLGVFTGLNFCPSFLIALSKALNLGGAISGMQVFLGFFFGTSLYLLPLSLGGLLARKQQIKYLAKLAALAIAIWFIYQGISGIYKYLNHKKMECQLITLDLEQQSFQPVILTFDESISSYLVLADSLSQFYNFPARILSLERIPIQNIPNLNPNSLLIISASALAETPISDLVSKYHHVELESPMALPRLMNFLRNTRVRLQPGQKLSFRITGP